MKTSVKIITNEQAQTLLYLQFGHSYIKNKSRGGTPGIIIKRGDCNNTACELTYNISEMDNVFLQNFGSGYTIVQSFIRPRGAKASIVRVR